MYVVQACLGIDQQHSTSFNCELIVGWLSWQQEETLSIWTITVAMETKFLFSINNLPSKCVRIQSLNVQSSEKRFWGGFCPVGDAPLNFRRLSLFDFVLQWMLTAFRDVTQLLIKPRQPKQTL